MIPRLWTTERLRIQDAASSEVEELRDVFNSCSAVFAWDPVFHEVDAAEIAGIVAESERPPEPDHEFRMQTIRGKDDEAILGYFHFTVGKPLADLTWISMFVMRPEHRSRGYAKEVVEGFLDQIVVPARYRAVRLDVAMRNWPALRFWIGRGFTRVVELRGDPRFSESAQARIVLERVLR